MCQLTLANLNSEERNKLYTAIQLNLNSLKSNKDGTGFLSVLPTEKETNTVPYYLFKFKNPPHLTTDWDRVISKRINGTRPVLGHVRLATYYNKEKNVCTEKAHPFISPEETFVLAHNGQLEFKSVEANKDKKYEGLMDTEVFIMRLEEVRKTVAHYDTGDPQNMVLAIQKTMEEFKGKFAFLIFDFFSDTHFVVRGKTADLHYAEVVIEDTENVIGFVVNTEKESLVTGLKEWRDINNIVTRGKKVDTKDPVLLDAESIYIVNKTSLEKVGEVAETPKFQTTTTRRTPRTAGNWYDQDDNWNQGGYYRSNYTPPEARELVKLGEEIYLSIVNLRLDMFSLEVMSVSLFGSSLMNIGPEEYTILATYLKELEKDAKKEVKIGKKSKTKIEVMEKALRKVSRTLVDDSFYEVFPSLKFPWVITPMKELLDIEIQTRTLNKEAFI